MPLKIERVGYRAIAAASAMAAFVVGVSPTSAQPLAPASNSSSAASQTSTSPDADESIYMPPFDGPICRSGQAETDSKTISVAASQQLGPPSSDRADRKIKFYRNPMGLADTSPTPKKDSMGMDYIPVYEEDFEEVAIHVGPAKIQRAGVESALVGRRAISRSIRVPGKVQIDERRISVISPRFDGFVQNIEPVTTGTRVKKGEVLVTVFGQELLNQGARLLVEQKSRMPVDAVGPPSPEGSVTLSGVIGAHRRLLNLGASEEFIEKIEGERQVPDVITIASPRDGVIVERNLVDGQAFKAGDVAFRIADLSVVWVIADVPESDIGTLTPGQDVTVSTRSYPGHIFRGTISLIYPQVNPATRTARVRVELPNPDLMMLADMYADVEIAAGSVDEVVALPANAVIYSGSRQLVLLDRSNGRFEVREVKLGREGNGFVEVLRGVAEDDQVVVNGNFLIDAESNLQAAIKSFGSPSSSEAKR